MSRAFVGLTVALALIAGACGQSGNATSAHKAKAVHVVPTSTPQRKLPAQLVIPKISVTAPVEQVGVDRNNNMDVPSKPSAVAWYSPGPAPGEAGDAVIDGHLDWTTGKAVFWDLHLLQAGDEIDVVAQGGTRLRFKVTDTHSYSYTAHPAGLFATTGQPQLSLITCSGSWDKGRQVYLQRLVVNASYAGAA
jgi:LPXTG-site transpeptidase (sortase) family protein